MDQKETTIYHAVLTAAILIGTILLYLMASIIKQQRVNSKLRKQNLSGQLEALDKDRARIAADLHDSISPLLTVIRMTLCSFELNNTHDGKNRKDTLSYLDTVLKKLNEISFNLMPNSLLQRGLVKTLHEYISFLNSNHSIRFLYTAPPELKLTNETTVHLYRITLELIHNAIRHANATEISVELRQQDREVHLNVSDNGTGFDFDRKLAEQPGNGLRNLCNRTLLISGKMFMDTRPGKGTTAIFEIPF